ncbi:restriction endonuclease [Candidatus Pacearchaeota archaeon]|nr:restriction endonuclease [Candidatus Pacearchaeota archaeon]|tara:strand:+ start:2091 stop:3353 length:1263 start_codon:yes stop_codon:yes gene_type:complete
MANKNLKTSIGIFPEDWKMFKLINLIETIVDNRGRTVPTSKEGIALIATNCIKEMGVSPVKEKVRYVSKEIYRDWFRGHPKMGDIILVNKGTPGLVCLVPENIDFCIAQDMIALRVKKEIIYNKYLFAFMRSHFFKYQVDGFNVGTTVPHLKKSVIGEILVPLPTMDEQIKIGDFYYNLSLLIEKLRSESEVLKEMSTIFFKRWFLDLADHSKNITNKSNKRKFEKSSLGKIPEGWKVKPLDEIATFLNGLALQKYPPRGKDDLPVIKIREIKQGITNNTDKANSEIKEEYIINNGDLLFSWSGSLEVDFWGEGKGALNQHLFKVSSEEYPLWFIYLWLLKFLPEFRNIAEGKATTMGHIKRKHLSESQVLIPNKNALLEMDSIMGPLIKKIINNKVQSSYLFEIRQTLLPKLLSGELRI